MCNFKDRVALVPGAGGGIGRATALELGLRGAAVAVNYRRSREGARRVADEIRAAGGQAEVFEADVTRAGQVRALIGEVESRYGRIDVLVNNAGDLVERRPLAD